MRKLVMKNKFFVLSMLLSFAWAGAAGAMGEVTELAGRGAAEDVARAGLSSFINDTAEVFANSTKQFFSEAATGITSSISGAVKSVGESLAVLPEQAKAANFLKDIPDGKFSKALTSDQEKILQSFQEPEAWNKLDPNAQMKLTKAFPERFVVNDQRLVGFKDVDGNTLKDFKQKEIPSAALKSTSAEAKAASESLAKDVEKSGKGWGDLSDVERKAVQENWTKLDSNYRSVLAGRMDNLEWISVGAKTTRSAILQFLKDGGQWLAQHAFLGGVIMSIFFGMPNSVQARISEETANLVQLGNLGMTVQFGQWTLLQIPDEFIVTSNVFATKKIYMLVPLHVPKGDKATPHNPIVGPSDKNIIADFIKTSGAASVGSNVSALMSVQFNKIGKRIVPKAEDIGIHRYNVYTGSNIFASYYDSALFFASMPAASWGSIGDDGLTDPTFSGRLVCLNNGAIIDESGVMHDLPLVPLFGSDTSQGPTIEAFLDKFYPSINIHQNNQSTSSEKNIVKGGVFDSKSKSANYLIRQFDKSCIDSQSRFGVNCMSSTHQRASLLSTTLQQMQEGLYITAQGKVATLTDLSSLASDFDAGALGNVFPVQGYGNTFMSFLKKTFPNIDITKFDVSGFGGVLSKESLSDQDRFIAGQSALDDAQDFSLYGAEVWNYPAYNLYVYTSYNTPFARDYKYITGLNMYDLIIFLNEKLEVVPLMAPVIDKVSGMLIMGLNPQAKLFVSLFAYNKLAFQLDDGRGGKIPPVFAVQDSNILGGVKTGMAVNIPGVQTVVDQYKSVLDKIVPNSNIGKQLDLIEQIVMYEYRNSPELRPYDIVPVDDSMNLVKNDLKVFVYQGIGCYPLPIGDFSVAQDYLIPFDQDENGSTTTVQLPNRNANLLISLVTDVVYSIIPISQTSAAGIGQSYILKPIAFTGQFDATTSLNLDTTKPKFVTLQRFTSAGITVPDALQAEVEKSYTAWSTWLENASKSSLNDNKEQLYGIQFGDGILQISSISDLQNQNYMYSFIPSFSNVVDDLYVVADSINVTQNTTVGLKATGANKYIVSLATGIIYDSTGQQVVDANNKNVVFDKASLLNMILRNQKSSYGIKASGMSIYTRDLLTKLQQISNSVMQVEGPFMYGLLRLFMYHTDVIGENYLFLTQDSNGQIDNYFVAVDSKGVLGGPVTKDTQAVVSLVTGTQYTAQGQSGVWPDIKTLLATVQKKISISGKDLNAITTMSKQFQSDSVKADAQNQAEMSEQDALTKARLEYEATLPELVARINVSKYLPVPYDFLKKDSQTGKFYSVRSLPNNELLIIDFDAFQNQIALFNKKGLIQIYYNGPVVNSMREQYGIQIDAKGNQALSVPQEVAVLGFSDKDKAVKPGQSGDQLICCTDPLFPLQGLAPLNVGPVQYTFYYFTPLSLYLVYVYDSVAKSGYYLNIGDGSQYDQTGLPLFAQNAVAVDAAKNLLFPTQDAQGFLTVMLPDPKSGNLMTEFDNQSASFTTKLAPDGSNVGVNTLQSAANTITVLQAPLTLGMTYNEKATTYSVYYDPADQKKSSQFQINPDYSYYSLDYIPLDAAKGTVVQQSLTGLYATAKMILNKGAVIGVVYNGKIYSVSKTSGNNFVCVAPDNTSITVQQKTDSFQNLYVVIQDGTQFVTYRYEYAKKSSVQMQAYMQATWKIALTLGQNMDQKLTYLLNVKGLKTAQPGSSIMYESAHDRYFVPLTKAQYSSVDQDAYVDLATGILFDRTGASLGHSMFAIDFAQLLQDVGYVVRYDSKSGKNRLVGSGSAGAAQAPGQAAPQGAAGAQSSAALGGSVALGSSAQNSGVVPPALGMTPPPSSVLAA